jgi:hypothetical protein
MNEMNKIGMGLEGPLDVTNESFEAKVIQELKVEVARFASGFPMPGITTMSVF